MSAEEIRQVAIDIAAEVSQTHPNFCIGQVAEAGDTLAITFLWSEPPSGETAKIVNIRPANHETALSVRDEIVRQFRMR